MSYVLQANKKTTISGDITAGATTGTLASAAFTNFTDGFLVIDYDNDSKFEIVKCTVTGTALSAMTRGQDGTSDVTHSSGAKIGFMFVPSHWTQLASLTASDAWTTWSPTHTGFSVDPTVSAGYLKMGKLMFLHYATTVDGTSNATTFTITNVPFAAKRVVAFSLGRATDSGTTLTVATRGVIQASATTIQFFTNMGTGVWTNSSAKAVEFTVCFETT